MEFHTFQYNIGRMFRISFLTSSSQNENVECKPCNAVDIELLIIFDYERDVLESFSLEYGTDVLSRNVRSYHSALRNIPEDRRSELF